MTAKPLRYAMVGGGPKSFIGPVHRMAIRMDGLAELVDGCYSHADDWRALIERVCGKVDFLVVCTPNSSHYEIASAALAAGLDVLCEKPLSLTAAEAARLGALARRRRRVLGIPFTYTGFPMVKLARDLVRRGELGRIDKVVVEYLQGSFRRKNAKSRAWKMDPRIAGPSCVVADIGVHGFTLVEYVTGLEVKELVADLSCYGNAAGLDDDASILMRLTKGAKASFDVSKIATGEENGMRLRVYGEHASLFWDQEESNYLHLKFADAPERIYKRRASYIEPLSAAATRASRFPAGHHEGFVEAFANIYDEFCAAVRDRRPHDFPGAREGVRSMRFVEAALASSKAGAVWRRL